ncbi:Poly(glycerol-phosphate) alpha-glucosyltransferase [Alkalibacterium sp. AK22]|uniref:glycosyltransferase family 4 protein n=1 Tax=Alkalibacterium sp. AK22 TaxID=1229520 RepID=UPI0004503353|nr:glycosyltransferase family 4 protein [Alkalibacterium sp. AK22]EXJ23659.1 Poly(glycerol-phosphate) alpha-glucosyltransferase [Alkalibacterium sp. AK22]
MKVAHINAGNEYGGGLVHIVSLLEKMNAKQPVAELLLMEEGPVAKAAREKGIPVKVFEQQSRYDLLVLKRLLSYVNEEGFSILHSHGPRANMLMKLLQPLIKAKWVATVHSHPLLDFKERGFFGRVFEKVNTSSLLRADGLIAVSEEIRDVLIELGCQADRVCTIHNGIDFKDPISGHLQTEKLTLIMIGRLHPIKNFALALEVLSQWEQTNWQLLICGEGQEKTELQQLAVSYGLSDQVCFLGWLNSRELKMRVHQSDLMIHPSLSESFPLVLLEAAEQQVPVIATDVGDVRCLLSRKDLGWLISPADSASLLEALEAAYIDWQSGELKQKGERLRKQGQQFSLTAQVDQVRSFYEQLN